MRMSRSRPPKRLNNSPKRLRRSSWPQWKRPCVTTERPNMPTAAEINIPIGPWPYHIRSRNSSLQRFPAGSRKILNRTERNAGPGGDFPCGLKSPHIGFNCAAVLRSTTRPPLPSIWLNLESAICTVRPCCKPGKEAHTATMCWIIAVSIENWAERRHLNDYPGRSASTDLGLLLDIVPNHMAIGGKDNLWWWDVLENGQSSRYAPYFDVEWMPPESKLHHLVMLPVLGDHYGRILDAGEIHIERHDGAFTVHYHDHVFPVAPRSLHVYPDSCCL